MGKIIKYFLIPANYVAGIASKEIKYIMFVGSNLVDTRDQIYKIVILIGASYII